MSKFKAPLPPEAAVLQRQSMTNEILNPKFKNILGIKLFKYSFGIGILSFGFGGM